MVSLLNNINESKAQSIGQLETYRKAYRATKNANYALQVAIDRADEIDAYDPDAWHEAIEIDFDGARSSFGWVD